MHVKNASLIDVPNITDPRGELGFVEGRTNRFPFDIQRVFWVRKVPPKAIRGGHAHKMNQQMHICLAGSVTFVLDDGTHQEEVVLTSDSKALYTGPLVWHHLKDWKHDTILLVLNSIRFQEEEYIRDYSEFRKFVGEGPG